MMVIDSLSRAGIKAMAVKRWSSEYGFSIRRLSMAAVVFFVLATEVLCLVLYKAGSNDYELPQHATTMPRRAAYQPDLITTSSQGKTQPTTCPPPVYLEDKLSRLLRRASMQSRTIILTTINEAWAKPNSTFDLFVKSFQNGDNTSWLLKHLVVVALDQKAYKRCKKLHTHCYFLKSQATNFSGEAFFMSPNYLEMVWRKIDFLHKVLKLGYNFIFTDADIMWFRDPFPHFYTDADVQVSCDIFNGNSSDVNNLSNTGLQYAISNDRTIQFYKFWYDSRKNYSSIHDQDAFDKIKNDSFVKDIGLKMRFLDTTYFSGFCELSKDLNKVCTVHANCCLGLNNKLHDLDILLGDWKTYILLSSSQNASNLSHWTVPQKCHI